MDEFVKKVEKTIKEEHLLNEGDKVVLGVSGGADSVALLSVLAALQKTMRLELIVVHIHHGLRGIEADGDRDFVEDICKEYHLPFICYETDIRRMAKEKHISEEEAGRIFRYDCFWRVFKENEADKIAVAHHMDDTAETVLMNLFRGSGLKGISGIPARRDRIVRPLIRVSRKQIEAYLLEKHIHYRTDATNFETDYTRNKVRLELLPYAKKNINSLATEHIAETALLASDICDYIEQQAVIAFENCVVLKKGICQIDVEQFLSFHVTIQREVLRLCLGKIAGKLKDIGMMHIESVRALFLGDSGRKISLPYGMYAVKNYQSVAIKKEEKQENLVRENEMAVMIPGHISLKNYTVHFYDLIADKNMQIPKNLYTKWLNYDTIKGTLTFRYRKEGDYMEIGEGHKKALRRILMDSHIPKDDRDTMMFLAEGNHILWIPDTGRISEYYKVNEHTHQILVVSLEKLKEKSCDERES